jgi:hypothetical protein
MATACSARSPSGACARAELASTRSGSGSWPRMVGSSAGPAAQAHTRLRMAPRAHSIGSGLGTVASSATALSTAPVATACGAQGSTSSSKQWTNAGVDSSCTSPRTSTASSSSDALRVARPSTVSCVAWGRCRRRCRPCPNAGHRRQTRPALAQAPNCSLSASD